MPTDYLDAQVRHWEDAESLRDADRIPNADQLFGFSAECGLKWLMLKFGMTLEPTGTRPTAKADQQHIDGIWDRYESYRQGRFAGRDYELTGSPFKDWNAGQRYCHRSEISKERAEAHRDGAAQVRELIGRYTLAEMAPSK